MQPTPSGPRPVFDWSINLGHLLTFVGFIVSGAVAWQTLDKRVVVLEQQSLYQAQRDAAQDAALVQSRSDLRETLRDVRTSLDKLNDRLQAKDRK